MLWNNFSIPDCRDEYTSGQASAVREREIASVYCGTPSASPSHTAGDHVHHPLTLEAECTLVCELVSVSPERSFSGDSAVSCCWQKIVDHACSGQLVRVPVASSHGCRVEIYCQRS